MLVFVASSDQMSVRARTVGHETTPLSWRCPICLPSGDHATDTYLWEETDVVTAHQRQETQPASHTATEPNFGAVRETAAQRVDRELVVYAFVMIEELAGADLRHPDIERAPAIRPVCD